MANALATLLQFAATTAFVKEVAGQLAKMETFLNHETKDPAREAMKHFWAPAWLIPAMTVGECP